MTKFEIIQAINEGKKVYWKNENYEVVKEDNSQYLIKCLSNFDVIGLCGKPGTKYEHVLNGKESDFFIK